MAEMMNLMDNPDYAEDVERIARLDFDWERLHNRSFLISGGSGMVGSILIDVLMCKNREGLNCTIHGLSRDRNRAMQRFQRYWEDSHLTWTDCDINDTAELPFNQIDYIFHGASNTHPMAYAMDPIGTILTNITGLNHLLNIAVRHGTRRFLFASSVEIYGEDPERSAGYREREFGYIDCNTLRAGYPESKRAGEALCQAYAAQKNLDIVIPRLSRVYGPSMLPSDTKAISQFITKGLNRKDIVLKSQGTQLYSFIYGADAVSAILCCLFRGQKGAAYNVADKRSDISLRSLAELIAGCTGGKVVMELPPEMEALGYSRATRAVLDSTRLQALGWEALESMESGIKKTLKILDRRATAHE